MKRIVSFLLLAAILTLSVCAAEPAHPNADALRFCRENGILQGDETGNLRPDDSLTRAEAAAILVRLAGAGKRASLAQYRDVRADKWYYTPLQYAVGMGLLQGSDGNLNPQASMTRQEGWVLLARLFGLQAQQTPLHAYPDAERAAAWAAPLLAALEQKDALGAGTLLRPGDAMTRAEFVETLYRLCGSVYDGRAALPASGSILCRATPTSGARIAGDLLLAADCGDTVRLTDCTVGGRLILRVREGAEVILTGTRAQELCILSSCTVRGGSFRKTRLGAERVFVEAATSLGECSAEVSCALTLDGTASRLALLCENSSVGGRGSAGAVRLDAPGCEVLCRSDSVEKAYDTAFDELEISLYAPDCRAGSPTVTVNAAFSGLPEDFSRQAKLVWCVDGVPYLTQKSFSLKNGAQAELPVTMIFSEQMKKAADITLTVSTGTLKAEAQTEMKLENFPKAHYTRLAAAALPYRIEVIRNQNVVLIRALDEAGEYSLLQNAFLCSTGPATCSGTYQTGEHSEWRTLFGTIYGPPYVYGQYSVRIDGNILFHSVPYFSQSKDDLEYLEFNKLGTSASMGCVRLCVAETKWIYDNCPVGTYVQLYDAPTLKIPRPTVPTIDPDSENRGWDPTDPDPQNPWRRTGK